MNGAHAYLARGRGDPWARVAASYGYADGPSAIRASRRWAERTGKPWPPPLPEDLAPGEAHRPAGSGKAPRWTLRLPVEDRQRVRELAAALDVSDAAAVRWAVRQAHALTCRVRP